MILLFPLIIILIFFLNSIRFWKLEEVNYIGIDYLERSELDESLNSYIGRNIFLVNPTEIEKALKEKYVEISEIRVEKLYNSKLNIYIHEKIPHLILVNFNGIYLFDTKGEVLKLWKTDNTNKFSDLDYELARGFGDPNGTYIEDRIYQNLSEEELENFNFEEMNIKDKEQVLEMMVIEKQTKFNSILSRNLEELKSFSRYDVPVIKAWEETVYEIGEFNDKKVNKFLGDSVNSLESRMKLKNISVLWDGDLRLICTVNKRMDVILSPSRSLSFQLEDLGLIMKEVEKNNQEIKMIDLTSEKVLVEYW